MTPKQKQIAIAEFEGWTGIRGGTGYPTEVARFANNYYSLPPYLTSRDAVCGAMARLDAPQGAKFVSHLAKVQGWTYQHASTFSDSIFSLITATPAQLADALLLTIGKEI